MLRKFILGIEQSNQCRQFASINFSQDEQEMFYHFSSSLERQKVKIHDSRDGRNFQAGIPDHVSFHKNGQIHVKYKKSKHREKIHKLESNMFDLVKREDVYPILFDCVYNIDKVPLPVIDETKGCKIWATQKKEFGVLLLLIHKKADPASFMQKYSLNSKYSMHEEKILVEAFNDFFIMIAMCNVVMRNETVPNTGALRGYDVFPKI